MTSRSMLWPSASIADARHSTTLDGLHDMEALTLRTPLDPDITFSDDPLRMMRAIRFASQLGFFIDPDTFAAIGRNAGRIEIISRRAHRHGVQ